VSTLKGRRIAIVGVGMMGRTLARGLLRDGKTDGPTLSGTVGHEGTAEKLREELDFPVGTSNEEAVRNADVVLLCVKPRKAVHVVSELARAGALEHRPLLLSIAAGVSIAALEGASGGNLAVVRAMPNTPARIGHGMTVLSGGTRAGASDLQTAIDITSPMGRVLVLDEEHMDAVTGLSASGPAFVYVIIEALAEGGVMVGLPRKIATELAAQCVQGAAQMVLQTGRHPAELKDEVTTPAGCTVSALLALEDGKLRSVLARGVQEAARAASELTS